MIRSESVLNFGRENVVRTGVIDPRTEVSVPRSLEEFLLEHRDALIAVHRWGLVGRLSEHELPIELAAMRQLPEDLEFGLEDFTKVVQLTRAARLRGAAHTLADGSRGMSHLSVVLSSDGQHLFFVAHPEVGIGAPLTLDEKPTIFRGSCDSTMKVVSLDPSLAVALNLDLSKGSSPNLASLVSIESYDDILDCWVESALTGASSCSVELLDMGNDLEAWQQITFFHSGDQVDFVRVSASANLRAHRAQQSRERLRNISETVPHGIFRLSDTGALIYKNSKFEEIYGNESWIDFSQVETIDGEMLATAVPKMFQKSEEAAFDIQIDREEAQRVLRVRTRRVRSGLGDVEYVGSLEDVTKEVSRSIQLEAEALTDPLTGAHNRRGLENNLDELLDDPNGKPFAVLLLDLDGFKQVNDSLGHGAGDRVIAEFGQRLIDACRGSDLVGRLGGDEFVMVLRDVDNYERAMEFADRLLPLMRNPFKLEDTTVELSGSIGVALAEPDSTVRKVLQMADHAMYQAKRAGRNQATPYHTPDAGNPVSPLALRRDLRQAIGRNGLDLAFQPIFGIDDLIEPVAAEALLRWDHPTLGSVDPSTMIPIAEQSGLMGDLGEWIINESVYAAAQINQERREEETKISIHVNVSALQVGRPDFAETIAMSLEAYSLAPELLTIELTESYLIDQLSEGRLALDMITDMGVRLAIDDFGTGFSTFEYLITMPVYSVKIDPSFTQKLNDPRSRAMLGGLGKACRELDMHLIVEGVETPEQLLIAREAGATHAQGFLLGSPIRSQHSDAQATADETSAA